MAFYADEVITLTKDNTAHGLTIANLKQNGGKRASAVVFQILSSGEEDGARLHWRFGADPTASVPGFFADAALQSPQAEQITIRGYDDLAQLKFSTLGSTTISLYVAYYN